MHTFTYRADGVAAFTIATTATLSATIMTTTRWEGATLSIRQTTASVALNDGKPITTTALLSVTGGRLTIAGTRTNAKGVREPYRASYSRRR